jgi:ribosome recycling factor
MIREIVQEAEEKMNKTVDVLKKDFASLRAGRATPALLDKIQVDYYGALILWLSSIQAQYNLGD